MKIRTVTVGLPLTPQLLDDPVKLNQAIADAAAFNKRAQSAFEAGTFARNPEEQEQEQGQDSEAALRARGGFEVQTTRIVTSPLEECCVAEKLLSTARKLDLLFLKHGVLFANVGPFSKWEYIERIPDVICNTRTISCSAVLASSVDIEGARRVAQAVAEIAQKTENGEGNFRFCLAANCKPGVPFFPTGYHRGPLSFSIGLECSSVIAEAFRSTSGASDVSGSTHVTATPGTGAGAGAGAETGTGKAAGIGTGAGAGTGVGKATGAGAGADAGAGAAEAKSQEGTTSPSQPGKKKKETEAETGVGPVAAGSAGVPAPQKRAQRGGTASAQSLQAAENRLYELMLEKLSRVERIALSLVPPAAAPVSGQPPPSQQQPHQKPTQPEQGTRAEEASSSAAAGEQKGSESVSGAGAGAGQGAGAGASTLTGAGKAPPPAGLMAYGGIDASMCPSLAPKESIALAFEQLGLGTGVFGGAGTLTLAALVTRTLKRLPVKLTGYSGLMLPVCEDYGLSQRANQGTYSVKDLLLYSSVCGVGLDTVPVAGAVSVEVLAALMLDVHTMSMRLAKPLSCRLFPVPGKRAGDMTTFESPYLHNCKVLPLT